VPDVPPLVAWLVDWLLYWLVAVEPFPDPVVDVPPLVA